VAFTIAVNDEANAYNQNVSLYLSQTKEQRESKQPKTYFGNGAAQEKKQYIGNFKALNTQVAAASIDDQSLPF
jgi:hypothetical protein